MNEYIKNVISGSIQTKKKLLEDDFIKKIESAAQIVLNAYKNDNKVIFAGNGGSAADSQHLAAEFVSRFEFDRPGLPSLSLSTDTSMITAISNDYGYKNLFSRQLEAQAKEGDVFIGITTSGKSENILNAFESCVGLYVRKEVHFHCNRLLHSIHFVDEICGVCKKHYYSPSLRPLSQCSLQEQCIQCLQCMQCMTTPFYAWLFSEIRDWL